MAVSLGEEPAYAWATIWVNIIQTSVEAVVIVGGHPGVGSEHVGIIVTVPKTAATLE